MKFACMRAAALSVVLLSASVAHASPPTVNPEQMDIGVENTAKLVKEKSKKSSIADGMKMGRGGQSDNGGCGTVNINNDDKKSNSGIKDMFGKQTTTIVTGPVINMASCK